MVRFRFRTSRKIKNGKGSLNSTMVRFRSKKGDILNTAKRQSQFHYGSIQIGVFKYLDTFRTYVSIPLWFDSDEVRFAELRGFVKSSQFHYGSIQMVWVSKHHIDDQVGLNSTMVRFRFRTYSDVEIQAVVSIPLWFDSDRETPSKRSLRTPSSQFHYGSIQINTSSTDIRNS